MSQCRSCGGSASNSDQFCGYCGQPIALSAVIAPTTEKKVTLSNISSRPRITAHFPTFKVRKISLMFSTLATGMKSHRSNPPNSSWNVKKRQRRHIIVLSTLLLISLVIASFLFPPKLPSTQPPPSSTPTPEGTSTPVPTDAPTEAPLIPSKECIAYKKYFEALVQPEQQSLDAAVTFRSQASCNQTVYMQLNILAEGHQLDVQICLVSNKWCGTSKGPNTWITISLAHRWHIIYQGIPDKTQFLFYIKPHNPQDTAFNITGWELPDEGIPAPS